MSNFTFNEDVDWDDFREWLFKNEPETDESWFWYLCGIRYGILSACVGNRANYAPNTRFVHRSHFTFLVERNSELFAKRITVAYGKEHEFLPRKELR